MHDLSNRLARLRRVMPSVWLGVLLAVATLATPAAFAVLPRPDAGLVAARILGNEAGVSLVVSVALLIIERERTRRAAESGAASSISNDMLLILAALFCTVLGYFGAQWVMPAARAGQAWLSFGQWHALSVGLFGAKTLAVGLLAWRAAR
jgi:nitrate reductase gamma subunit